MAVLPERLKEDECLISFMPNNFCFTSIVILGDKPYSLVVSRREEFVVHCAFLVAIVLIVKTD